MLILSWSIIWYRKNRVPGSDWSKAAGYSCSLLAFLVPEVSCYAFFYPHSPLFLFRRAMSGLLFSTIIWSVWVLKCQIQRVINLISPYLLSDSAQIYLMLHISVLQVCWEHLLWPRLDQGLSFLLTISIVVIATCPKLSHLLSTVGTLARHKPTLDFREVTGSSSQMASKCLCCDQGLEPNLRAKVSWNLFCELLCWSKAFPISWRCSDTNLVSWVIW